MSGTVTQNLKQAFEVEEVPEYQRKQRVGKRATDGITKGLVFADELVVVPAAWMVYFPGGHSLRVESIEEMHRLGFLAPPPTVDMETGEEVPLDVMLSPKQIVMRNTHNRRSTM